MKIITKLMIGCILVILISAGILFIANKTGRATATVEFSIISNVTEPVTPPSPGPSGGGGGGVSGGGITKCIESWQCDNWGECSPSEYQVRSCFDSNLCGTIKDKPTEIQRCNYVIRPAICFNNAKDNNEEGIDCGGSCAPCPNCNDGIKNQDEEDVDCGGACGECVIGAIAEKKVGIFSFGNLIRDVNSYWSVWLLLSILLLILIQLYNEVKDQVKEYRGHRHYHV